MSLAIPILPPTTLEAISVLMRVQDKIRELPQEQITTHHVLHGGMYARTVKLIPDQLIVGCLYKVPTMLVVNGPALVFIGDGWARVDGYSVVPARKGRKQMFLALGDVSITMLYATKAQTVEEAEREMTDEFDALLSRVDENVILATGE